MSKERGMSSAIQLELDLWQQLEAATQQPESADLGQLWQGLEQAIATVPRPQQLPMAAAAISQIVEVFTLRADWLLSALEVKDSSQGPVLSEDFLSGLLRQSMSIDLADLKEEGFVLEPVPRQRRSTGLASGESVAGLVDKDTLLEVFDTEIELVEAQAEATSEAVSVAHSEDVTAWAGAIARWLQQRSSTGPVSFLELQQGVGMPLVEVWLGLLLRGNVGLEQRGSFYTAHSIYISL